MTPARKKEIVQLLAELGRFAEIHPKLLVPQLLVSSEEGYKLFDGLRDAMEALEQAENQLAELGRENQKLKDELTEFQLLSVKSGTVRMGPSGSEEAEVGRRRGRGRR